MSFPTIVYKCPGDHFAQTGTYSYRGAADKDALDVLLSDGWSLTLGEAMGDKPDVVDDAAPTRSELEQKANELGLKFDGRTTDSKLAERIVEALEA